MESNPRPGPSCVLPQDLIPTIHSAGHGLPVIDNATDRGTTALDPRRPSVHASGEEVAVRVVRAAGVRPRRDDLDAVNDAPEG